ncbi:MAG: Allergen V5/Tpx family protein [Polaromonas sp.]|jgi:uncharacterized protein YkwD|nr:Allergen V5/Tpx family protein [Polaromonas sp.]
MKTTNHGLLMSSLLLLALAGCGGGGGSSVPPAAVPAEIPPPVASTDVPAANGAATGAAATPSAYAAGSEELAALNLLNAERSRCGFGTLAQNASLDTAARAHADYQIINNLLTHMQDAARYPRGFTGTTPADRVRAAGYANAAGVTDEIVAFSGSAAKTGLGAEGVRGLLSAPYHLRGLMAGHRDVGVSVRSSADLGTATPSVYLQINAAHTSAAGAQTVAVNSVNTYPCQGSTGIKRLLSNETPNPIPNRDLAVNPLGPVVYVGLREGNTLVINSSAMVELATGRPVALRPPIGAANDPHAPCQEGCFKRHEAYIAADAPVAADAAFQMVITGTNNGVAFSRTFTFTTGSGS